MKKNLAKRIVLGILTGTVLMSSSVACAYVGTGNNSSINTGTYNGNSDASDNSVAVGINAKANGTFDIAIGANQPVTGEGSTNTTTNGMYSIAIGYDANAGANNKSGIAIGGKSVTSGMDSIAMGGSANAMSSNYSIALGYDSELRTAHNSVALGYGSIAQEANVVSVGSGGVDGANSNASVTRRIINVTAGTGDTDAVNVGQMKDAFKDLDAITYENYQGTAYDKYAVSVGTLKNVLANVSGAGGNGGNYVEKEEIDGGGTETKLSNNFVVTDTTVGNSTTTTTVTINENDANNPIVMNTEGITVGTNSTRMDGTGFYVWDDTGYDSNNPNPHNKPDAIAAVTNDGTIKGVNGTFSGNVTANNYNFKDSNGSYTDLNTALSLKANVSDVYTQAQADSKFADKAETQNKLNEKADKTALEDEKSAREQGDQNLQSQIDQIGSGAIAGLNQRLEKTNAKINKVGAGAAALAALHPLDYDPDDKLTFSAGMGNYAGENAAALGAFYRPNEKFMLSLGGTMGNGENMVNLGLSIGLDKPNGFAKLSKRELIQKVNVMEAKYEAVEAENEAMKDQLANADERIAKLEALVAQLVAK